MRRELAHSLLAGLALVALIAGSLAYNNGYANAPLPQTSLAAPAQAAGVPAPLAQRPLPPLTVERTFTLNRGETLYTALERIGLGKQNTSKFLADLSRHPPLQAGQKLKITYTENPDRSLAAASMDIRTRDDEVLRIAYKNGTATAELEKRPLTAVRTVAVGRINHSLYLDATEAGLPARLVGPFANLFAWELDFTRDIQPGDTFKVMFEELREADGTPITTGKILAAEFHVKGGKRTAFLFDGEYYDEKGTGKKQLLLRTPLEFTRISSHFNLKRKHPVLGYTRAHRGTDFAAPTGTPIKASGSGVVQRANYYGSFGNYVKIKHNDTYSTAYAHLHRFAKGIRAGTRVKQGQIIGYVGTTGRSTGPHLHYEVHKNGVQVDAMNTKLPTTTLLAGNKKAAFNTFVAEAKSRWDKAFAEIQLATR